MARRGEGPSTATIFRVIFTAAIALVILYALFRVRAVLLLVVVAAFLAVGLDPAVRWLERRGLRRGIAVGIIFGTTLLVFVGFAAAVVPPLVRQVTDFATNLPDYIQHLADKNSRIKEFVEQNNLADNLRDATQNAPKLIGGSLGTVVGFAGSVIGGLFSAITVVVLTIYFSLSLSRARAGSLRFVPRSRRDRVQELADPILGKIGGYIAGNVAISVIAGVAAFIFMVIARIPFPVALALWVALADLLPLVGATLGAIPAVIVAFFVSPLHGIATVTYFVIYQQVENYVVAPRVMKTAVDISPAAVLLAALIGGSLLGFVGALMAIPFAASIKLLAQEVVFPAMEKS
ncbi:MAG TPA: AI-2E family transporter [Actinomycetota bacterium]|nr:AI-2E family transporter [Actinomycetota bacterium]